jgi:hypothetical protein
LAFHAAPLEFGIRTNNARAPSLRQKSITQIRRDDRAEIILAPEDAIPSAGYKIVNRVAQSVRHNCQDARLEGPDTAQTAKDVKKGVGTKEEVATFCKHDDAVRESGAALGGYLLQEGAPLQRREEKSVARAVMAQNELHGAMAKAAVTVVEENFFRRGHGWDLRKNSMRCW